MPSKIANPSVPALYEDALVYETGSAITSTGALSAYSGAKTGRSPSDKRVVEEDGSKDNIWWGPVNKPMSPEVSGITIFLRRIFLRRHDGMQTTAPPIQWVPRSSMSRGLGSAGLHTSHAPQTRILSLHPRQRLAWLASCHHMFPDVRPCK